VLTDVPSYWLTVYALSVFFGMLLSFVVGRRLGLRHRVHKGTVRELAIVDTSVFGLMGLLLAFAFSGAGQRYDDRRKLIVDEANAIGTAYRRVDLLPVTAQPSIRDDFRRYADARVLFYRRLDDVPAAVGELAEAKRLQGKIWSDSLAAAAAAPTPAALLLVVPALNTMIDITTTRTAVLFLHPPWIIFVLLGCLALACGALMGFDFAGAPRISWLHMLGFTLVLSATIYMIVDLEFPRRGIFGIEATDRFLAQAREEMK
jgi:hypothetical protein